ncbi:MAG: DUF4097 family beta strand repeat-containing protein [Acidimicrobiales bacterium]
MIHQRFDTPGKVEVRVANEAGDVRLATHGEPATEVEVIATGEGAQALLGQIRVDHRELGGHHQVVVEVPSRGGLLRSLLGTGVDVTVAVVLPDGGAIEVATASGDISADGRFSDARAHTASGDVFVRSVEGDLYARSASGDLVVSSVQGATEVTTASGSVRCESLGRASQVKTASGDVTIGSAGGRVMVQTASGDIFLGELASDCQLQTASGDQRIERAVRGEARLQTVSGDVTVRVARGTQVAVDAETVTGGLSSEIDLASEKPPATDDEEEEEGGQRVEIRARSVTGDLRVERAPA